MKVKCFGIACLFLIASSGKLCAQVFSELRTSVNEAKTGPDQVKAWTALIAAYTENNAKRAAQIVDSLVSGNGQLPYDDDFAKAVFALMDPLIQNSRYQELEKVSKWLISFLEKKGQEKNLIYSKIQLGTAYVFLGEHDKAKHILEKGILEPEESEIDIVDHLKMTAHVQLGIMHGMNEELADATIHFKKGDSLAFLIHDQKTNAAIAGYMGNIYISSGQIDLAIESMEKAKKLGLELGDKGIAFSVCDNLANCYKRLNKYEEALQSLAEGRVFGRALGDSAGLAINYGITGQIYSEIGESKLAQEWLDSAYQIHVNFKNVRGQIQVLNNMSRLQHSLGNYDQQIVLAHKQLRLASKFLNRSFMQNANFDLWQAFDKLGNLDSAYHYVQWYWHIKDSINRYNFTEQSAYLQTQYQTGTQKNEIAGLETEAALSKEREAQKDFFNRVLLFGIITVFAALLALTYLLRNIKKSKKEIAFQNAKLAESDKQKATLLKELHHRVKNNLQIVSSLLNLQSASVKDLEAQAAFKEGQNRVDAMAMIHRHLYATDELTSVHINTYLERLVNSLAYSYGYNKSNFELKSDITTEPVDVDVAIPIGLIVNELVSNTFKHAFKDVENAQISLSLQLEGDLIQLLIKDNGKGLPANFSVEESSSFGLELVHTLVNQLKGKISFQNQNGAIFTIQIDRTKTMAA